MSKELLYTLVRFMGKVVASIVVLIAIVGGSIAYLEIGNDSSSMNNKTPEVKFSNFEEFKNLKHKEMSKKELRALKDKFQEDFFKKFDLISKNISIYAGATNQPTPNDEALEEHMFMIVTKYNYDMRTSFLSQLVTETSNLVSYSEVIATDKTKSNIEWTDFLDWFVSDFDYQLNNTTSQVEYITIEASNFEKATIAVMILIVIMLALMMSILLRRDTKDNPVVVAAKTEPVKPPEPAKTTTPAKTATTPLKKKPVAKKKPVVKKEEAPEPKKEEAPEVKPTTETK